MKLGGLLFIGPPCNYSSDVSVNTALHLACGLLSQLQLEVYGKLLFGFGSVCAKTAMILFLFG